MTLCCQIGIGLSKIRESDERHDIVEIDNCHQNLAQIGRLQMLVILWNSGLDFGQPRITEMAGIDTIQSLSHGNTIRNLGRAAKVEN